MEHQQIHNKEIKSTDCEEMMVHCFSIVDPVGGSEMWQVYALRKKRLEMDRGMKLNQFSTQGLQRCGIHWQLLNQDSFIKSTIWNNVFKSELTATSLIPYTFIMKPSWSCSPYANYNNKYWFSWCHTEPFKTTWH